MATTRVGTLDKLATHIGRMAPLTDPVRNPDAVSRARYLEQIDGFQERLNDVLGPERMALAREPERGAIPGFSNEETAKLWTIVTIMDKVSARNLARAMPTLEPNTDRAVKLRHTHDTVQTATSPMLDNPKDRELAQGIIERHKSELIKVYGQDRLDMASNKNIQTIPGLSDGETKLLKATAKIFQRADAANTREHSTAAPVQTPKDSVVAKLIIRKRESPKQNGLELH